MLDLGYEASVAAIAADTSAANLRQARATEDPEVRVAHLRTSLRYAQQYAQHVARLLEDAEAQPLKPRKRAEAGGNA